MIKKPKTLIPKQLQKHYKTKEWNGNSHFIVVANGVLREYISAACFAQFSTLPKVTEFSQVLNKFTEEQAKFARWLVKQPLFSKYFHNPKGDWIKHGLRSNCDFDPRELLMANTAVRDVWEYPVLEEWNHFQRKGFSKWDSYVLASILRYNKRNKRYEPRECLGSGHYWLPKLTVLDVQRLFKGELKDVTANRKPTKEKEGKHYGLFFQFLFDYGKGRYFFEANPKSWKLEKIRDNWGYGYDAHVLPEENLGMFVQEIMEAKA